MREGWEYKGFEDCLVKANKAKQVQTSEYNSGTKYPIISQEDKMISGYCDDESFLYHINSPVVIFGDHTRVLKYVDFDFVVGADGVKILIPKNFLKAKFLYYYLQWYKVPSLGYSRHYKLLKEISLPIPSLVEQERIVSELDLLSGIIEKKKAQLKEYDKLAQSIFYDMFGDPVTNEKGWEVKKLGEVCEIIAGGDKPTNISNVRTKDFCFPVIANGEGEKGILGYSRTRRIVKDSVTIGARGASIGNCRIVYGGFTPVVRLITLTPDSSVNCYYLFFFTNLMPYNSNGAGQAQLTVPNVRNISIPLPPLPLQQSFASKIEAIERQKALIQQSFTETETLFNSRMDNYFD